MLQSVIGRIGIFMICAQAILQFRPKEAYGKYLRLLFSAMILIQIVQPIAGLFFGGSSLELEKSMQEFQSSLESSMDEAAKRAADAETQLEDMSLVELEERLEERQAVNGDAAESDKAAAEEDSTEGKQEKSGAVQKIEVAPVKKIEIIQEEQGE